MPIYCYHCELEVTKGIDFKYPVLGEIREFCCAGCQAIAQTICENQCEGFYRFRSEPSQRAEVPLPQEIKELEAIDTPQIQQSLTKQNSQFQQIELGIEGITCAACGWLIRKQLTQMPEVQNIQLDIPTRRAIIRFDNNARLSPILKKFREIGYQAYPFSEDDQEKMVAAEDNAFKRRLLVAGLAMMQVMTYAVGLYIGEFQDISSEHAYFLHFVSGLIATPVVFYSAKPFLKSAYFSLKKKHFGINLPVSIAILGGYFASVYSLLTEGTVYYFDSVVMFTFFLLIGRFLEHRTRLKAILKQQNFKKLLPISVSRKNTDDSLSPILIGEIKVDDRLLINAGAVVPVDGILLGQQAELNESVLTGEFIPVSKKHLDKVISGSTNTSASFVMQATSDLGHSRLQHLIDLQNRAHHLSDPQSIENNSQIKTSVDPINDKIQLADSVANWYVIILLIICSIVGAVWYSIDAAQIFPIILSLLVVSCPCALSLATPTAVTAAIAQLTDKGLMIKATSTLSKLSQISDIYFDKTGTLTLGQMTLVDCQTYSSIDKKSCTEIAVTLEAHSNHPIADAFKQLAVKPITGLTSQEIIASGVSGCWGSDQFKLGKAEFVTSDPKSLFSTKTESDTRSEIVLYLTKNSQHIASFFLTDKTNPTASTAVRNLQAAGYDITLISGDSAKPCNELAKHLKINQVIATATPEEKLRSIQRHSFNKNSVLMVGDGINDIGALAAADVSITLGSASQLSQSKSSAVLVSKDLNVIYQALHIAKKLDRIIKQNIGWAVTYNLLAIPFAAMGLIPAWAAAIGMTSSSLIVVLNALRLRK